jgi:hypothetical protein
MWLCSASNCFAELIASVGQVALGADIASFTLNATPGVELNGMFREARVRRFSLSFEGIAAARSPEVSYLVFINAKDAKELTAESPGYVGSISFFGGAKNVNQLRFPPVSFEISEALVRLDQSGRASLPMIVSLKPTGRPATGSIPSIEKIGLFAF